MREMYEGNQEMQNLISQYEHQAFTRESTAENPLMAVPYAVAIPGYNVYKQMTGAGRSEPSMGQVVQGYKGIYQGLMQRLKTTSPLVNQFKDRLLKASQLPVNPLNAGAALVDKAGQGLDSLSQATSQYMGDKTMEATGSPELSTASYMVPAALGVIGNPGKLYRPLENLTDNLRRPLSDYTDTLFRDVSLSKAEEYLPTGGVRTEMGDVKYFSNTPDLALGQKGNTGVMLEFDPTTLDGQINKSKPAWEEVYKKGGAEFTTKMIPQDTYQKALKAVTIRKDAMTDKISRIRMKRSLEGLEKQGWVKDETDDLITYRRPDK